MKKVVKAIYLHVLTVLSISIDNANTERCIAGKLRKNGKRDFKTHTYTHAHMFMPLHAMKLKVTFINGETGISVRLWLPQKRWTTPPNDDWVFPGRSSTQADYVYGQSRSAMKVSRAKRKIRLGVEEVKSEFEDMIQHHVAKMNSPGAPIDPAAVILGTLPHLLVLAFTAFIVWLARPGSSESACALLCVCSNSIEAAWYRLDHSVCACMLLCYDKSKQTR